MNKTTKQLTEKMTSYNDVYGLLLFIVVYCIPYSVQVNTINQFMNLEPDRIETTIKILANGRYTWTITKNTDGTRTPQEIANDLKQLDGALADAFPNHVKVSSFKVSEISED